MIRTEPQLLIELKKAAELMSEYSIKYNILTVVNDKVASNILEIYSYYKENGWNYQQYIACLDPLDESVGKKICTKTRAIW